MFAGNVNNDEKKRKKEPEQQAYNNLVDQQQVEFTPLQFIPAFSD